MYSWKHSTVYHIFFVYPILQVDVTGIVNGMDTIEWDPENDKYLDVNYNATTVRPTMTLLT